MKGHCPRFDQGAEVRFGSISISQLGIRGETSGKATGAVSWAAVQSYSIEFGSLVIATKGQGTIRFPTSRIPNLAVLMHAVARLAGNQQAVPPAPLVPRPSVGEDFAGNDW
jgi:hypothetical protein